VVVDVDSNNEIISAAKGGRISGAFQWCRYPPSPFNVDKASASVLLTNTDLEEAFVVLDFLRNLLPAPPFGVLVLPNKMRGPGNKGSDQRLSHSKSAGPSWMATGELQMMNALLRMDGRYGASVVIVSFTDMQLIKGCFELLQSHLSAKKYEKELMDAKEEELREIAKDLFQEINNEDMRARAQVQYVMEEQEKYSAECSAMVSEKY
jgi:hypothetical protein